MNTSARERILLLIMPALVVLVVYLFFFSRHRALNDARRQIESLQANAVSPAQVALEQAQLDEQRTTLHELRSEQRRLNDHWGQLASAAQQPSAARARMYQQLSSMLWRHGLIAYEESQQPAAGAALPAALQDAMKRLQQGKPQSRADSRLWKVQVVGRYADVMAALQTAAEDASYALPVGVTMAEGSLDSEWRAWTLLFWM